MPSEPRETPAMRQFAAFKEQHPECILFFRMGDFYETFYEDAVTCHKALGITLTERTKGIPMAGVPYHSVEGYLRRMIEQGFRVAVAEQIQDPAEAKGVVDRAVTRIVTPGTLIDESLLDDAAANRVGALFFTHPGDDSPAALAVAELSTGSFEVCALTADCLTDEITRLGLAEILHVETATGEAPPWVSRLIAADPGLTDGCLTGRPSWYFRSAEALEALCRQFAVTTLAGFGLDDDDPCIAPAGALVRYLLETQAGDGGRSRLAHLRPPKRREIDAFLRIDPVSLRSLEIEKTARTGDTSGSLLSVFSHCRTPMGRRLLRDWLCFPLRSCEAIIARQRCVQTLVDDTATARTLGDALDGVQDVARIGSRLAMNRGTPRDLVALGRSLHRAAEFRDLLAPADAFAAQIEQLAAVEDELTDLAGRIETSCIESPPAHTRDGGIIRDGVDEDLDEARSLQHDANAWLARFQQQLISETGIPSLKVGYNKVFGYYIEVTAVNASRVPDAFTRKQTLKNAERYITPELKDFENRVLTARDRAIAREQTLFDELCADAAHRCPALTTFADAVAELDVLACFARQARRRRYCRPDIIDEPALHIVAGRHPVLDELLDSGFVPNDTSLNSASLGLPEAQTTAATLALITGPNMAGKSTCIRQVALITMLAHTGSFVPAESAVIGLTDRIFTRIGANDELHAGRSTFMVEMIETANILHHATGRSLVILDEIGRGTSTFDGLSLAWAIAENLAARRTRTLFATHYHELTALAERAPAVANLHVAVREWADEIVFLYRIQPGRADRSYGIYVARIAGLPPETISRAMDLCKALETHDLDPEALPAARNGSDPHAPPPPADAQLSLFREFMPHPALDELRALDLNSLTPLQAFDLLRRLRDDARQ